MWFSVFLAFGEFFYHVNIRTPHWLGYFIQRPESHRLHHLADKRFCKNYGDLPIWDMLGGTFENPTENEYHSTGFSNEKELKVSDMMVCRDVVKDKNISIGKRDVLVLLLILLGSLHTIGHLHGLNGINGIAFATGASPLPLVFTSYNGFETFSTTFVLNATLANGTTIEFPINNKNYQNMLGPYNRRNVYGAIFAYGPFFNTVQTIRLRQRILSYGLCGGPDTLFSEIDSESAQRVSKVATGALVKEFGFDQFDHRVIKIDIQVKSKTAGNENKTWVMSVEC